ncbi:MAG: hypothetical protein NTX45_28095 [Proteobacteria bacterium]|nr:hypothetical protein [Pseudomonadota bacterium]
MTQLEHIQTEIASLPKQEFVKLREWIETMDWEDWDRQIAEDSASGKLDFLKREAMEAKVAGKLRPV